MKPRVDARAAEDAAARFLRRRGYKVAQRNFATPLGEIDIVATHQGEVVFVEVKARAASPAAPPEVAVDHRKRAKLRRIAQVFLERKRLLDAPCRFDVVALTRTPDGDDWEIELFQDAF
ncbi:MAG: YraN family protein [bacterium]